MPPDNRTRIAGAPDRCRIGIEGNQVRKRAERHGVGTQRLICEHASQTHFSEAQDVICRADKSVPNR
jgi:hypothetical protein